jgi:omega-amidase
MRLSIVQADLIWEDPVANRRAFDHLLAPLKGLTDVAVLPEMFTTGFSMHAPGYAESMDGPTMQWMHATAAQLGIVVAGSFMCTENDHYYNRFAWVTPEGECYTYDKRHLFAMGGEHHTYTPGDTKPIFVWQGWRICPLICYDLRFPVWSAPTGPDVPHYDLLLYVANWPSRRSLHWSTLLQARAIENQAYTIGVNRVGRDGNDLEYNGDSAIVEYSGQILCRLSGEAGVYTAALSLDRQNQYRNQLPFLKDADRVKLF